MQTIKTMLCIWLLTGFYLTGLYAQENTVSSGGNAAGPGGTASYSVGQVAYTTLKGDNTLVTQGVQQPYDISVVSGGEETYIRLEYKIYPNPTRGKLTLLLEHYEEFKDEDFLYCLYDMAGNLIEKNKITQEKTVFYMHKYVVANFFLKVIRNKKEVKTFKIIKLH